MNTNKKVLLAEDDPDMLDALKDTFESNGFIASTARNGEEGLAVAIKEKPAIIILDILMPKMDGLTMLKKLREDSWGQYAPVVILTNLSESTKLAEALEIGVSEYIIKTDISLKDLVEKAKRIIGLV